MIPSGVSLTPLKLEPTTHVIVENVDDEFREAYSLFKLGEVGAIRMFSDLMHSTLIAKVDFANERYALYTTSKSPLTEHCKKSSLILSESIAAALNVPLFVGEYEYAYDANDFYDDQLRAKRKTYPTRLARKEDIKNGGYRFVMLDDSIVSGASMRTSLPELEEVTESLEFFVFVDLGNQEHHERLINNFAFNKYGVEILSKIARDPAYRYTSHMVRSVCRLSPPMKATFLKSIGTRSADRYLLAHGAYFNDRDTKLY